MDRSELLALISKPKNEDVIIYDIKLNDLIDVDVFKEYYNDLAAFKIKKDNYNILLEEIKQYENSINNIYLYRKDWEEMDYLDMLKKDKKSYSQIFDDIKKIENKINILNKKYISINEKIEIQKAKDIKDIENKRKTIDEDNQKISENINILKVKLNDIQIDIDKINQKISDNELEKKDIELMLESINNDAYTCKYCGTTIKHASSKKRIYNLLEKNIKNNLIENQELLTKKSNLEKEFNTYENEHKKYRIQLRNNIEFKKQDYNFYIKKSLEVLKLEGIRDNILNELNKTKKEYNSNPRIQTEQYKTLKDRIDKYELSLQNIQKIKKDKLSFNEKYSKAKQIKLECVELKNNIEKYQKFISIFFKIYQQKVNDYFGKDFSFTFYRFNQYELEEILELKYKDINYHELNKTLRKECDEIYLEKIRYFS